MEIEEGKNAKMGEGEEQGIVLHLFKAKGIQHPEFWQCIRYIAPSGEQKEWKSKDAVGVCCTEYKTNIPYHSMKNTKGVEQHIRMCTH